MSHNPKIDERVLTAARASIEALLDEVGELSEPTSFVLDPITNAPGADLTVCLTADERPDEEAPADDYVVELWTGEQWWQSADELVDVSTKLLTQALKARYPGRHVSTSTIDGSWLQCITVGD